MGKAKQPTYNPPAPTAVPTAQDLFSQSSNYAQQNQPMAYGAREGALKDLNNPNYYAGFQPTSMESALGNQYFQNIWPDMQKSITNNLSLSGISSSPVLANTLAKQQGNLGFQVGSYLSDQGNQRATNSLNARLGIDPSNVMSQYLNTAQNQGNMQANNQNAYQQALAQQQYQQQMNQFQNQQSLYKTIGQISPLGGALYGGISGGSTGLGSSLSGTTDSLSKLMQMYMAQQGGGMGGGGNAGSVNPWIMH